MHICGLGLVFARDVASTEIEVRRCRQVEVLQAAGAQQPLRQLLLLRHACLATLQPKQPSSKELECNKVSRRAPHELLPSKSISSAPMLSVLVSSELPSNPEHAQDQHACSRNR